MLSYAQQFLRYVGLTVLTIAACGVMWWVSKKGESLTSEGQASTAPPPSVAAPKARVAVANIRPQLSEVTIKYSGKIRSLEDYSLGFEIGGRVASLGVNEQGQPLDDGDSVRVGQVLARLDDRILRAQRSEAVAQQEQAASDLAIARNVRDRGGRQVITDAEYQEYLTQMALAKARQEIATKNLEDTVLVSPVDGTISRRRVEAGESVNPHAVVFEVVENHNVLLVIDIPEARVRELELRKRSVAAAKQRIATSGGDPEEAVFRARVQLEGRDVYGRPWEPINAEVFRIAALADERTGLFEVEVLIPNEDGLLRPGMVATAEIVTDRLLAYQAPENAVVFRNGDAYLYHLQSEQAGMKAMFWEVGKTDLYRAERIDLNEWVDQGDVVLLPAASYDLGPMVVRGQQRLSGGQLVRVSNPDQLPPANNMTARRTTAPESVEVN